MILNLLKLKSIKNRTFIHTYSLLGFGDILVPGLLIRLVVRQAGAGVGCGRGEVVGLSIIKVISRGTGVGTCHCGAHTRVLSTHLEIGQ